MSPETLDLWEILNILFRLGVAAIVIVKLAMFYDYYNRDERFGLGVAGGCALLTVPVVWQGPSSPFAGWAGMLFAFGVLVYFSGGLRRKIAHARANREAAEQARAHFAGKQRGGDR